VVHNIHTFELTFLCFAKHCSKLLIDEMPNLLLYICSTENWSKLVLLSLVVDDLTFLFASLLSLELAAHAWVAESNEDCLSHEITGLSDNLSSDGHHDDIEHAWVSCNTEVPFFVYVCNSHHHICSGDANMVKDCKAIIFAWVTNFRADVTCLNSWVALESIRVTKWYKESLGSIVEVSNFKASHHNSVGRMMAKITRPELSCSITRCVNDEFIFLLVKSCSCKETSDIWTVTYFCLSITYPPFLRSAVGYPLRSLLFIWQVHQGQ
jgi:hypothetical protein